MTEIAKELEKLFPTEEVRKRFITMAILEFQLSVDDLEDLLGIDKKIIYEEFVYGNRNIGENVKKEFDFYGELPGVAKERFLTYLNRLQRAIKYGNEKLAKSILEELYDKEIVKFKRNHEFGERISDEEILAMVKYQIKYSLTMQSLLNTFHINKKVYSRRLKEILPNYPDLQTKFEFLMDFYRKSSKNEWQRL